MPRQLLPLVPFSWFLLSVSSATPLHWAGAKGHVFVVRLLMMQEADVNSRDSS